MGESKAKGSGDRAKPPVSETPVGVACAPQRKRREGGTERRGGERNRVRQRQCPTQGDRRGSRVP